MILHKFNNFTKYGEMLVFLMCFAYFFCLGLESVSGWFPVVNHIFANMFSMFTIWAAIILCAGVASAGELAMRAWTKLISSAGNKYVYKPLEEIEGYELPFGEGKKEET